MITQTIERIVIGTSAPARASFVVPAAINTATGSVTWEILDEQGVVYASGTTVNYQSVAQAADTLVTADATIVVPSTLPVNVMGSKYQLRWHLVASGENFYNYETFTALSDVPPDHGPEATVEVSGKTATFSITLPDDYQHVQFEIYQNNTQFGTAVDVVADKLAVAEGFRFTGTLDTSTLTPGIDPASFVPYQVLWSYWNTGGLPNYESGRLYVVTPSMLMAANDIRDTLNRAHTTINGAPDVTFTIEDLMGYLRMGMDQFNGYGNATNFTMTNATGPVRFHWIAWSQIQALRSQYLAEGDKAFNFSGQSVSLDSDRTAYYESLASAIESRVTEDCRQLKILLSKRGLTAGDGNVNALALKFGAIGAIGISMSPVSNLRVYGMTWPFNRGRL